MLDSRFSLVIHFIHSSVYMSISISQFIPPLHFPPWCPYICSLRLCLYFCLANKIIYTIFPEAYGQTHQIIYIRYAQIFNINYTSVQFSRSVVSDPMNRSTPGLPVHHQLPELTQTHIHRVSDAIQPSHPLSSPSPPAPNPSQHQSLFQ